MEVKWQLQSCPPLSSDCRSLSQISLFDCERNSILGHSYQSWQSGIRNSGCCWIVVVSCPSSRNNEGKNRGGRNAILAVFVPFKDRYTGNTRFERIPSQEKSHAL